jgi:hypothetical protein
MMQGRVFCALWLSLAAVGGLWAQDDATGHEPECRSAAHAGEKYVEGTHGCSCQHLRTHVSRIFRTSRSAFDTAQEFILETNEAWCSFWDKAHADLQPKPPCRGFGVNFSREAIVAVALGEHNGCYGIEIDHVHSTDEKGVYLVFVNELKRSSSDCLCAETLVHPVDAMKLEAPVVEVFVERSVKSVPCNWGRVPIKQPMRRDRRHKPLVDKPL